MHTIVIYGFLLKFTDLLVVLKSSVTPQGTKWSEDKRKRKAVKEKDIIMESNALYKIQNYIPIVCCTSSPITWPTPLIRLKS